MLKRVLLIDPKGFGSGLNIGLAYLAAMLLDNGFEVKVLDFNNDPVKLSRGLRINLRPVNGENRDTRLDRALKWKPQVIGISINSFTLQNALEICQYCHGETGSDVLYVAGGPHISMFKEQFLEKYGHLFNYAVVGEGEKTLVELLKKIRSPERVKGIIYFDKKKKKIVKTVPRPLIDDLNSIPFPNFEVFDTVTNKEGLFNYQMMSSRGCPYQCSFCFHAWSRRWRARSVENIRQEILLAMAKYRMRYLTFWDDNFTLDLERAKNICRLIHSEIPGLKYSLAGVRADRIDEELVKILKESGCIGVSIGIEDGDPATFSYVGKGETLSDIKKAVNLIKKYDIPLLAYMVIGLIGTSYQSFLKSLRFVERLGIKAHWSIAFPFPETPLYDWAVKNGRFKMTLEEGFKSCMTSKNPPVVFDTANFTKEERTKAYYLGNLRSHSYDMAIGSRDDNIFKQAADITGAIWKYDRTNLLWHLLYLASIFQKVLLPLHKSKNFL